jgi:hypothetical protein
MEWTTKVKIEGNVREREKKRKRKSDRGKKEKYSI